MRVCVHCNPQTIRTVWGSALVLAERELGPAYLSAPPAMICCEYSDCACERSYPVVATTWPATGVVDIGWVITWVTSVLNGVTYWAELQIK